MMLKDIFTKAARALITASMALLLLNTGCSRSCGYCPVEEATNAVILSAASLNPKWHLVLEDSCVKYDHGIVRLNLVFSSMELLDLCQARFLLVDMVETYLCKFNFNTVLNEELRSRPFSAEDLNIVITFESFFGQYVDLQYLCQIRMYNGCVTYYSFDAFDPKGDTFHKHSEFYNNTRLIAGAQYMSNLPVFMPPEDIDRPVSSIRGGPNLFNALKNVNR